MIKIGALRTFRLAEDSDDSLQNFQLATEFFSGPFEVLLNLIDEGKIDLFTVSLSQITSAYLGFIKENQNVTINSASEFLLLAAYLIERKSLALLPAPEAAEEKNEELETDLVSRLEEYRRFKQIAADLRERKTHYGKVRYRFGAGEAEPERPIVLKDVNLKDLVTAFQELWEEVAARGQEKEIEAEPITLEQRIDEVRKLLKGKTAGIRFRDLFRRWTRLELVVTFLAVLELTRQRQIKISQGKRYGDIIISGVELGE